MLQVITLQITIPWTFLFFFPFSLSASVNSMLIRFHNYIISFNKKAVDFATYCIMSFIKKFSIVTDRLCWWSACDLFLSISIRLSLRISNWPEFFNLTLLNEVFFYLESIRDGKHVSYTSMMRLNRRWSSMYVLWMNNTLECYYENK